MLARTFKLFLWSLECNRKPSKRIHRTSKAKRLLISLKEYLNLSLRSTQFYMHVELEPFLLYNLYHIHVITFNADITKSIIQ